MLFYLVKYAMELFRISGRSTDHRSSATILIGIALFGFLLTLKQGTVHNSGVDMMVYIVIARLALFERNSFLQSEGDYEDELDDEEGYEDEEDEAVFSY